MKNQQLRRAAGSVAAGSMVSELALLTFKSLAPLRSVLQSPPWTADEYRQFPSRSRSAPAGSAGLLAKSNRGCASASPRVMRRPRRRSRAASSGAQLGRQA